MRIAIDCRKIADFGIGTYLRGLIAALAAGNNSDDLVAFIPSRARQLIPARIETVVIDAPTYRLREMLVVGRAIERARADVFHAPHVNVPFTTVPVVTTIHDVIPLHFRQPLRPGWWYMSAMTRRAAGRSQRILTVSEASKSALVTELGCSPEKIDVAPNGVDARFFSASTSASTRGRYVLYAGNDKPHKNVAGLVAAFEQVRRRLPDMRLVLCGARFRQFSGRDGVELAGYMADNELPELFAGASVFALPSFEEGFGLPAVEAMAAGTPVVTSATPAMLEVTGDAALHVDPHSQDAIAAALVRALEDEPLRQRLRRTGLERARQFTWSRCSELTMRAYHAAAARQ